MADFVAFKVKATEKLRPPGVFEDDEEYVGDLRAQPQASLHSLQEAGNAAAAAQDWSSALKAWNEALSRNPPKDLAAKLHEQKAQVLLELGRTWEALKASALATECQPNWAPGYLTRGRAQLNYGEPELSIESLEMVLKLEPGGELAEAAAADLAAARVLVLQRRQREERDRGARVNTNDLKL